MKKDKTHTKGDLISERFFTLAQISKNGCQITPLSTIHVPKEKLLRGVIWHQFLEILVKVKNVLRLSHL